MAVHKNLAVFALLVLCFAVAPSTQRFALHVDEVYPNFGPTVEILELNSGFLDTEELDVSTLRVQSPDGVTITTPGGFTLDGASFSSNADDVSITTTSSSSEINIIGANALDFFGNTVDFSSSNGNIDLRAEADMQFIGLGTFDAQVDNFRSVGDNIAVSATAGAISFAMGDDFTAGGSLFSADGINGLSVLAAESLTLESVFNNLDVNGNTVALSGNTLAVNADRNNVVLAAASTLSGSFDDITFNGPDGIYVVSMESSVSFAGDDLSLTATNGDFSSTALFEAVFQGEDAVFSSNTAGTRFVASSGMLAKLSDSIAFTATNDLSLSAVENFSAHSSVGSVSVLANSALTFAGTEGIFGSVGATSFDATDEVSLNAANGMYITAAQSIVYGSQLPPSTLFPIAVDAADDVSLGGSTVAAQVNSLDLDGSDVVFRTSDLSRDSTIQMVAEGALSIDAVLLDMMGGAINVEAAGTIALSAEDMTLSTGFDAFGSQLSMTADGPVSFDASDSISFRSQDDMFFHSADISSISADFLAIEARRNVLLKVDGDLALEADDDLSFVAEEEARFVAASSILFETESDDIDLGSVGIIILRADSQISAFAADDDISFAGNIINLHGTTVDLDAEELELDSSDGIIAFAGDNTLDLEEFSASSDFAFLGSPAGLDIVIDGDSFELDSGDLIFAANDIEIAVDDFSVTATDILFQSGEQKPITIISETLDSDSQTVSVLSSDDVTFESADLDLVADTISLTASIDVRSEVEDDYSLLADAIQYSAVAIEFVTAGDHTVSSGPSVYSAETLSFVSSSGDIDYTVGEDFIFDAGLFQPTVVSMTATDAVRFSGIDQAVATGASTDWLQTTDLLEFSAIDMSFTSTTGDISFSGGDIDHSATALEVVSTENVNVFGRDVVLTAGTSMDFTAGGDILIEGSSVTLSQTGVTGTVTTTVADDAEFNSNGRLDLFSGGDFYLSSSLAANPPTERSIIITTSARSAGISIASLNANLEGDGDIVFLSTDYATGHPGTSGGIGTNSGGFDINVLATGSASYTSDFINGATSGVSMISNGAAYDKKLAINTGALFRSLSTGNIQLTSESRAVNLVAGDSVTFEAELGSVTIIASDTVAPNSITSGAGDIVYENLGGDIAFSTVTTGSAQVTAQGYGTFQSGAGGQNSDAQENVSIVVGGDFDLQADRGTVTIGQSGDAPLDVTAFNALVEGADDFAWNFGGSFVATTLGAATNCDGGNTVSAVCNDLTVFGDTGASFSGDVSVSITANTDILFESSLNNDVTFTVDNSVAAVTGTASITGGHNAVLSGAEIVATATDILFTTQGSHWITADGDLTFTSTADQLYEADHSLILESTSAVTVGGPAIANIYAGGLGRPFGIEINTEEGADISSDQDISVAAESFRAFSLEETEVVAENSMTIHSLGTPNFGTDIFFESAEDISMEADTQFLMTASNILMEFDTQQVFEGDIFISSQRAITMNSERTTGFDGVVDISADDVSFVSFLRDPVDAVTGGSTSATGNTHAQEWTTTGSISLNSADDMTWEADGIVTLSGEDVELFTSNTNSDISFETLGKLSDILVSAGGEVDSASTRVDITAVHSVTIESGAAVALEASDSFTSIAEGSTIFSSGINFDVTSTDDLEFTSTGRMLTTVRGSGVSFDADGDILVDADKDFVIDFPHRYSSASSSQTVDFTIVGEVDMLFGADFRFRAGNMASFTAEVVDVSVDGVFQDNNDGLSAGDQSFGFRITATGTDPVFGDPDSSLVITASEDTLVLANVDIDVGSEFLSVGSSDTLSVVANGPDGITVSTSEADTDLIVSGASLNIIGDDFVNFLAFGADTGVGYLVFTSSSSTLPSNLGYDFVEQPNVGMALVSDQGDVTFNARQAGIVHQVQNNFNEGPFGAGQNNTASYYMNPGNNGTLTLSSFGSDQDGLAFSASAAGTYLVSEHNIVLEGQNVRFEELGRDPYYAASLYPGSIYNSDFYDLQQTRAVVYGYTEQDWTAAGANENGNGIEVISSVPFEGILVESSFAGLSAGGSIRVEAAQEFSIVSQRDLTAESESSIIIEAHATSDEDIGVLIALVGTAGATQEQGHIQFHAEEDLLIDAAGRLLLEADSELTFSSGPSSNMNFNSASGFFVGAFNTVMQVGDSLTFRAAQDIVFTSENGIRLAADTGISIVGSNTDDTNSDVVFGFPNVDTGTLSTYGGVDDVTGSVTIDTNTLVINAEVFDIVQTASLILPEEFNFVSCGSQIPGSVFINYVGSSARLCYCDAQTGTFAAFTFRSS